MLYVGAINKNTYNRLPTRTPESLQSFDASTSVSSSKAQPYNQHTSSQLHNHSSRSPQTINLNVFDSPNKDALNHTDSEEISDLRKVYEVNVELHEHIEKQRDCIHKLKKRVTLLQQQILENEKTAPVQKINEGAQAAELVKAMTAVPNSQVAYHILENLTWHLQNLNLNGIAEVHHQSVKEIEELQQFKSTMVAGSEQAEKQREKLEKKVGVLQVAQLEHTEKLDNAVEILQQLDASTKVGLVQVEKQGEKLEKGVEALQVAHLEQTEKLDNALGVLQQSEVSTVAGFAQVEKRFSKLESENEGVSQAQRQELIAAWRQDLIGFAEFFRGEVAQRLGGYLHEYAQLIYFSEAEKQAQGIAYIIAFTEKIEQLENKFQEIAHSININEVAPLQSMLQSKQLHLAEKEKQMQEAKEAQAQAYTDLEKDTKEYLAKTLTQLQADYQQQWSNFIQQEKQIREDAEEQKSEEIGRLQNAIEGLKELQSQQLQVAEKEKQAREEQEVKALADLEKKTKEYIGKELTQLYANHQQQLNDFVQEQTQEWEAAQQQRLKESRLLQKTVQGLKKVESRQSHLEEKQNQAQEEFRKVFVNLKRSTNEHITQEFAHLRQEEQTQSQQSHVAAIEQHVQEVLTTALADFGNIFKEYITQEFKQLRDQQQVTALEVQEEQTNFYAQILAFLLSNLEQRQPENEEQINMEEQDEIHPPLYESIVENAQLEYRQIDPLQDPVEEPAPLYPPPTLAKAQEIPVSQPSQVPAVLNDAAEINSEEGAESVSSKGKRKAPQSPQTSPSLTASSSPTKPPLAKKQSLMFPTPEKAEASTDVSEDEETVVGEELQNASLRARRMSAHGNKLRETLLPIRRENLTIALTEDTAPLVEEENLMPLPSNSMASTKSNLNAIRGPLPERIDPSKKPRFMVSDSRPVSPLVGRTTVMSVRTKYLGQLNVPSDSAYICKVTGRIIVKAEAAQISVYEPTEGLTRLHSFKLATPGEKTQVQKSPTALQTVPSHYLYHSRYIKLFGDDSPVWVPIKHVDVQASSVLKNPDAFLLLEKKAAEQLGYDELEEQDSVDDMQWFASPEDGKVLIVRPKGDFKIEELERPKDANIGLFQVSMDGEIMAGVAENSPDILIWKMAGGGYAPRLETKLFRTLHGHTGEITQIGLFGKWLVATNEEGVIQLWNIWSESESPLYKVDFKTGPILEMSLFRSSTTKSNSLLIRSDKGFYSAGLSLALD